MHTIHLVDDDHYIVRLDILVSILLIDRHGYLSATKYSAINLLARKLISYEFSDRSFTTTFFSIDQKTPLALSVFDLLLDLFVDKGDVFTDEFC